MSAPDKIRNPATFLFRPLEDVTAELGTLSVDTQAKTIRAMLAASQTSAEVAVNAIESLGLEDHGDLLAYAVSNPWTENVVVANSAIATRAAQSRTPASPLPGAALEPLKALGVARADWPRLLAGEVVLFCMAPTTATAQSTEGFLQLGDDRLSSAIISVHDVGGGMKTILGFRNRSFELGAALGRGTVELLGAAVLNAKLGRILVRHGFELKTAQIPAEFSGGNMDVLARCYEVDPS